MAILFAYLFKKPWICLIAAGAILKIAQLAAAITGNRTIATRKSMSISCRPLVNLEIKVFLSCSHFLFLAETGK